MSDFDEAAETSFPVTGQQQSALVDIESARAVQEVQAAVILAKKFPRDQKLSYDRIMKACERESLAREASYAYQRGGKLIGGPSIRLAEVMAQNWGNLQSGIRELSQRDSWSEVQAYAWDLETNNLQSKTFQVEHARHTKTKGRQRLTDPRDIYELVANLGARRLRACILAVIPGDVVEAAEKKCEETLLAAEAKKPIEKKAKAALDAFTEFDVDQVALEKMLGHKIEAITDKEVVQLRKVYRSLKDGMAKKEDFFPTGAEPSKDAEDLTKDLQGKKDQEKEKEPPPYPFSNLRATGIKEYWRSRENELRNAPVEVRAAWNKKVLAVNLIPAERGVMTLPLEEPKPEPPPPQEGGKLDFLTDPLADRSHSIACPDRSGDQMDVAYCDTECQKKCGAYEKAMKPEQQPLI